MGNTFRLSLTQALCARADRFANTRNASIRGAASRETLTFRRKKSNNNKKKGGEKEKGVTGSPSPGPHRFQGKQPAKNKRTRMKHEASSVVAQGRKQFPRFRLPVSREWAPFPVPAEGPTSPLLTPPSLVVTCAPDRKLQGEPREPRGANLDEGQPVTSGIRDAEFSSV